MEAKWFCCHCDFSGVKSPTSEYQRRVAQNLNCNVLREVLRFHREKILFTHNLIDLPLRLWFFARDQQASVVRAVRIGGTKTATFVPSLDQIQL